MRNSYLTDDFIAMKTEDVHMLEQRGQYVAKLVESEGEYLTLLKVINTVYLLPLQEKQLVSAKNMADIFSNVQYIINVHEAFDEKMKEVASLPAKDQQIGALFVTLVSPTGLPKKEKVDFLFVKEVYIWM